MKRLTSAKDTGSKSKRRRIVKSSGQSSGISLPGIAENESDSDPDGVNPHLPSDSSTTRSVVPRVGDKDISLPSTSSGKSKVHEADGKAENKYAQFYKICQDANGKYGECLLCLSKGVT